MPDWQQLVTTLKSHGVEFDAGLTDGELALVEERFCFTFPSDLGALLQAALPRGRHFPDWRACDESVLAGWLNRPREGVLYDVANNNFWLEEWGVAQARSLMRT